MAFGSCETKRMVIPPSYISLMRRSDVERQHHRQDEKGEGGMPTCVIYVRLLSVCHISVLF